MRCALCGDAQKVKYSIAGAMVGFQEAHGASSKNVVEVFVAAGRVCALWFRYAEYCVEYRTL